jgi:hypothetical protein
MSELPPKWFPDHGPDGQITPNGQAKGYPYPAPEGDFWMRDGLPVLCPEGIAEEECRDRTPVISVGSNRAPLQLRRKFGARATLPVTSAKLFDCDIVYAATMSYYCAVPATAFPSPGTVVTLNIAWLDEDQLNHMHSTEALGVAYDFVRFEGGLVDHGRPMASPVFDQPIYGYQSRSPMMAVDQAPVAHALIPAQGRRFQAMDQVAMLNHVKARAGQDHIALDDWLEQLRQNKTHRLKIMATLAADGIALGDVPWQVVTAEAKDIDRYL